MKVRSYIKKIINVDLPVGLNQENFQKEFTVNDHQEHRLE